MQKLALLKENLTFLWPTLSFLSANLRKLIAYGRSFLLRVEEALDTALRGLLEGLLTEFHLAYFAICGQFGIHLL